MESVTFVYSLATEQERQTEALKTQKQNQLEKYRALIEKQMEKERAFLSYKKTEFLCKQEAKLGGRRRPVSARARMGGSLPEITTKAKPKGITQKNGFNARTGHRNLAPYINRQRTHLGLRLSSSKPKSNSTNTSPAEGRKSSLIPSLSGQLNSSILSSKSHAQKERKVHFENEIKGTRSIPKCKKAPAADAPKKIENETLEKRELNLPKCEKLPNSLTKAQREIRKVPEYCGDLREKDRGQASIDFTRSSDLHSFGKAEETKKPEGIVSWAVVARLIGLKTKFKRRQLHGTFQAPELEVLDPSLKSDRRFGQENANDPWKSVKGCRYLRIPSKSNIYETNPKL